jgi:transposase
VPGHLRRIEYVREKAVCACGEGFVVAPPPPQVVEGATYGPALHAHIAVSKCMDVMPLHRLSRAFERIGVPIAVATLCILFHRTADSLEPIYKALLARLPDVDILQADETTQAVLDPGRGETRNGWMWTFLDAQAIAFVFDPSRGGKVPSELLKDSKGTLLVDGHTGYNPVTTPEGRERAGCWSHARRGLFEARDYAPVLMGGLLSDIQQLFLVEQEAIEDDFVGSTRHLHLRRDRSGPVVERIFRTLDAAVGQFSPKSSVAKAMRYILNQKTELRRFLQNARVPIHNNASESALRIVALLRKNALFVGHDEGGRHLAILLSLCATCRLHGVNPDAWMTDALIRVTERGSTVEELLPWNWKEGRGARCRDPVKVAA